MPIPFQLITGSRSALLGWLVTLGAWPSFCGIQHGPWSLSLFPFGGQSGRVLGSTEELCLYQWYFFFPLSTLLALLLCLPSVGLTYFWASSFAMALLEEEQVLLQFLHFWELHTTQPAMMRLLASNVGQMEKLYATNFPALSLLRSFPAHLSDLDPKLS